MREISILHTKWHIKKFLIIILSIQLCILGAIGSDSIGIRIPIVRQFIGLIYTSFVPGILILKILKFDKLHLLEEFLYSIGLSLSFLSFIGFFSNYIYIILGIANPISVRILLPTICLFVTFLCIICYFRCKNESSNLSIVECIRISLPKLTFLLLIPVLSIFGAFLVNSYGMNQILMFLILIIAFVCLLISFTDFIPVNLYPLTIWVFSIALIWHYTLITNHFGVHDGEFYYAKQVIDNYLWDSKVNSNSNSALSVVIIPPIISLICGINLTWMYKLIFPMFLSFVPLGAYFIANKYLNEKESFLSAFIFLTFPTYYNMLPNITKQLICVFFLTLLLMVLFDDKMSETKKSVLSIIFAVSLIVSHYGSSFIVMFSLIFLLFFYNFIKLVQRNKFLHINSITVFEGVHFTKIHSNFVLLFILLTFSWYIYISSSSVFVSVIKIFHSVATTIFEEFMDPASSRGMYMLSNQYNEGLRLVTKYINLSIPFLCIIGLCTELLNRKTKFKFDFFVLSFYYIVVLFATVVVSNFAVMSSTRLFILGLSLLAPFTVKGGLTLFNKIFGILYPRVYQRSLSVLYLYFVLAMLLNTQFLYVLLGDHPTSISIGQEYVEKYGNVGDKAEFYSNKIIEYDISSLKWLSEHGNKSKNLYFTGGHTHIGSFIQGSGYFPMTNIHDFGPNPIPTAGNQYVLLIYSNVVQKIGYGTLPGVVVFDYFDFTDLYSSLIGKDKIYTNGCSEVLNKS